MMPMPLGLLPGLRHGSWLSKTYGGKEVSPVPIDRKTLIAKVKAAGVIGAGGAGFPTHVKLAGEVDTIIVNGAECEPLLAVDVQLMERQAELLVTGLDTLVRALGAKVGIIACKAKHQIAISNLLEAIRDKEGLLGVELCLLDDFYPAGDEPVLVYEVNSRIVPEGGIPLAVKCLVINVETLRNIVWALQDKPVVTTCVTIAGAVQRPVTLEVPVGTSFGALLDLAGGVTVSDYRLIVGGPMTGGVISKEAMEEAEGQPMGSPKAVVGKTTKGLIVLPANHALHRQSTLSVSAMLQRAQSACCQCRLCTDLCPRYLLGYSIEPHLVLNRVNHGQTTDPLAIAQAFLCSDCGVCELYACPVGLSPRRMYRALKSELLRQGAPTPYKGLSTRLRPRGAWAGRHIPASHLLTRLGLGPYDQKAPWMSLEFSPRQVTIPLQQHIGVAGKPLVQAGDRVVTGQTIATPPADALGAIVHSSIAGQVLEVTQEAVVIRGG